MTIDTTDMSGSAENSNCPVSRRISVLWVAPLLNHYKAEVLARLADCEKVRLTVITGTPLCELGHLSAAQAEEQLEIFRTPGTYNNFARCPSSYFALIKCVATRRPDWVLIPSELKYLPLLVFGRCLAHICRFKIFTVTHPSVGNKGKPQRRFITKFVFWLYDRVGLYTELSREIAVRSNLVSKKRSFYANNTLDTTRLWNRFAFQINEETNELTFLYIGRLIESKRVHLLLDYQKGVLAQGVSCKLLIVGDGPLRETLERASHGRDVEFLGAIRDAQKIAAVMQRVHFVFIPGASGLSIVHSLCFGKPYITIGDRKNHHGPEISYLRDGQNGLLLTGSVDEDVARIYRVFKDQWKYRELCRNAMRSGWALSVDNWCNQVIEGLG